LHFALLSSGLPVSQVSLRVKLWRFRFMTSQDGIFMTDHPSGVFQGLVTIIGFGSGQRAIKNITCHVGCRRVLERSDQAARVREARSPFIFSANVGGLKSEIDPPRRTIRLIRRHNLLAKQKSCVSGQLQPRFGAETDRRTVYDHGLTLSQFEYQIGQNIVPLAVVAKMNGGHFVRLFRLLEQLQ